MPLYKIEDNKLRGKLEESNAEEEKRLQKDIEQDLEMLEKGLIYIDSFVSAGSGIIDTLAIDNKKNLVVIEFKKGKAFADALVQCLDYTSFISNNPDIMRYFVSNKRPEALKSDIRLGDVRIIIVASDFDDRVIRGSQQISPDIKLLKYQYFAEDPNRRSILLNTIYDSTITAERSRFPIAISLDDHFQGRANKMRPLFDFMIESIKKHVGDFKVYPTKHYIGLQRNNMIAAVYIFIDKIGICLALEPTIQNKRLEDIPEYSWSRLRKYTTIHEKTDIDVELLNWFKIAYDRS